jgi:hypothetical protein
MALFGRDKHTEKQLHAPPLPNTSTTAEELLEIAAKIVGSVGGNITLDLPSTAEERNALAIKLSAVGGKPPHFDIVKPDGRIEIPERQLKPEEKLLLYNQAHPKRFHK